MGERQTLPLQRVFFGSQSDVFTKTQEHVKACREIFRRHSGDKYPTGDDLETAFWNTIGGIGKTMNNFLGPHLATPKLVPALARNYENHGEVAKRPLVDLWLDNEEFGSSKDLSIEAHSRRSRLRCSINVFVNL